MAVHTKVKLKMVLGMDMVNWLWRIAHIKDNGWMEIDMVKARWTLTMAEYMKVISSMD
jgi:hypothetical protein